MGKDKAMTTRFAMGVIMTLVGATFLTCSEAPLVVQGTVVQYNSMEKTIVIKDEQAPNQELTLQVSSAEMGTEPKEGEIVRISYHQTSQGMVGIRVMNVSHQIR
jgi:hypothetical protein